MTPKTFIALLSAIAIILLGSCSGGKQSVKAFEWPRQSFVKYEGWVYKQTCTPDDPDNLLSDCYEKQRGATGSGAVIANSFDGAYILTAAHMCDRSSDIEFLKSIEGDSAPEETRFFSKHFVYDLQNFKYNTEVVAMDSDIDACVTFTWGLFKDAIPLAGDPPKIGSTVYNMAAPAGFFGENMVPLFDGIYVGEYDQDSSIYTIPAIGGSSGSPIMNKEGELVGLIFARHTRFHHIILSSNYPRLRRFIISSVDSHTKRRNRLHNLDYRRSVIIKFGK